MRSKFEYKYKLKQQLDSLTHEEYKSALKVLPESLGISQRTFFRYMYTRIDEKYSMPVDHLASLAMFFNCKIDDMLNYDPPPLAVKVIKPKYKNELVKKLKLVK